MKYGFLNNCFIGVLVSWSLDFCSIQIYVGKFQMFD